MNTAHCRGDWMLGSACGTCPRCIETAKPVIVMLRAQVTELQNQRKSILACLPEGGPGWDLSDKFKIQAFEEARRIAATLVHNEKLT